MNSTLRVLPTPVTWAPRALASCTANWPTDPPAPMISTRWPAAMPAVCTAWKAAQPATGSDAASMAVSDAGASASSVAFAVVYSASDPRQVPNTSAPTARVVTFEPTAMTVPATSAPRTGLLGERSPMTIRTR
jgi:hypothetical protein